MCLGVAQFGLARAFSGMQPFSGLTQCQRKKQKERCPESYGFCDDGNIGAVASCSRRIPRAQKFSRVDLVMEDSEATTSLSTGHICVDSGRMRHQSRAHVRHAMVVINRMIRSPDKRDQLLYDRIYRAASVVRATDATETAVFTNRPTDVVFRLASRIVRGLSSKTMRR